MNETDERLHRVIPYVRVRELLPFMSKSTVYRFLRSGQLKAVKLGKMTLITAESVEKLLNSTAVEVSFKVKPKQRP